MANHTAMTDQQFSASSSSNNIGALMARRAIWLCGLTVAAVFALDAEEANAAKSKVGAYEVLTHWPIGIHENMDWMAPSDKPMCDALARAATETYGGKPFDINSDVMPTSDEIMPVKWEAVSRPDAYVIAEKVVRSAWSFFSLDGPADAEAELQQLKGAMNEKLIRLESTSADNFRDGEITTHFFRLSKGIRDERYPNLYLGGEMAVIDGSSYDHFLPLVGLESPESVITYRNRSYAIGRGSRDSDNAFKPLARIQPEITIFNGPVPICRVVLWTTKHH